MPGVRTTARRTERPREDGRKPTARSDNAFPEEMKPRGQETRGRPAFPARDSLTGFLDAVIRGNPPPAPARGVLFRSRWHLGSGVEGTGNHPDTSCSTGRTASASMAGPPIRRRLRHPRQEDLACGGSPLGLPGTSEGPSLKGDRPGRVTGPGGPPGGGVVVGLGPCGLLDRRGGPRPGVVGEGEDLSGRAEGSQAVSRARIPGGQAGGHEPIDVMEARVDRQADAVARADEDPRRSLVDPGLAPSRKAPRRRVDAHLRRLLPGPTGPVQGVRLRCPDRPKGGGDRDRPGALPVRLL